MEEKTKAEAVQEEVASDILSASDSKSFGRGRRMPVPDISNQHQRRKTHQAGLQAVAKQLEIPTRNRFHRLDKIDDSS